MMTVIITMIDHDDDEYAAAARFTPNLFSWIYPSIFLFAETLKV